MFRLSTIGSVGVLMIGTAAMAQEVGDPELGREIAQDICAGCHQISPDQLPVAGSDAPSFVEIAETPGMTATALFVWMQTSHPTMPNIVLEPDELRDVVAYILSLNGPQ